MPAVADPRTLAHDIRDAARPLVGAPEDFDPLMALVGDARFVLIGEASHGTHEFYRVRAEITKRLIREKGFTAVAVEADWPDAYRVNRYVRGAGDDADAVEALGGFERFPAWMWRNADVLDFVGWLRSHNDGAPARGDTGRLLRSRPLQPARVDGGGARATSSIVDPEAARRARRRYACFDHFGDDLQAYGYATPARPARRRANAKSWQQLVDLRRSAAEYAPARRAARRPTTLFYAEQNARLVRNAERYYRTMFGGRVDVVEPARSAHGRDARSAACVPSTQGPPAREGGGVGAQLAPRRRARHRDGRGRAS